MSLRVVAGLLVFALLVDVGWAKKQKKEDISHVKMVEKKQKLKPLVAELQARLSQVQNSTGSTFIRWGRKDCPTNSTLVYSGYSGGSFYRFAGGAANTLCLTSSPKYDHMSTNTYRRSEVFGAEYEEMASHQNYDVPCAVCLTPLSVTIMVPATFICPAGWTSHYNGYLTASYHAYSSATDFLCLDAYPQNVGTNRNYDGKLFYYTVSRCGSLPCPPFIDGKVVTCVVCSKK